VLRQDPDVILVGEIRDGETARTASEAAMTGHIVFTTVHAKDSFSAVFRLLELGVENTLVANALELVVAQRLVKVLCANCKRSVRVTPGQSSRIGRFLRGADEVYVATGCVRCLKTGYKGRRGLYEMLEASDDLRDCILDSPNIGDLKRVVGHTNFRTLQQAGWELAAKGVTSLDEVERVATTG
jgi:general secretion pathway protein E